MLLYGIYVNLQLMEKMGKILQTQECLWISISSFEICEEQCHYLINNRLLLSGSSIEFVPNFVSTNFTNYIFGCSHYKACQELKFKNIQ